MDSGGGGQLAISATPLSCQQTFGLLLYFYYYILLAVNIVMSCLGNMMKSGTAKS